MSYFKFDNCLIQYVGMCCLGRTGFDRNDGQGRIQKTRRQVGFGISCLPDVWVQTFVLRTKVVRCGKAGQNGAANPPVSKH